MNQILNNQKLNKEQIEQYHVFREKVSEIIERRRN